MPLIYWGNALPFKGRATEELIAFNARIQSGFARFDKNAKRSF